MARPKEKTGLGSAFEQKCAAATEKLSNVQATLLRDDLHRLYNDELLTDLTLTVGGQTLSLHTCIVEARSSELMKYLSSDWKAETVTIATSSHKTDAVEWFRALYTDDDITSTLAKIESYLCNISFQALPDSSAGLGGTSAAQSSLTDVLSDTTQRYREDLHVISENITNTSLDLVKLEVSNQKVNQSCFSGDSSRCEERKDRSSVCDNIREQTEYCNSDSSCKCSEPRDIACCSQIYSDENVYKLAETIVQQVLNEAKAILRSSQENTGFLTESDSPDEQTHAVILNGGGKNVNANNYESTGRLTVKYNSESETNICHSRDIKQTELETPNLFSINSTNHSGSLQDQVEKVYSLNTAIRPCSQLGEDLLWLLVNKQCCDCVLEVSGARFPAHKCILAARSSYFAAMLGGSWRESAEDSIILEGIQPETLKQTLLYLYGGVIQVDPLCSLGGLMMIADMYGIEGLKEVVTFNLNMEYCHFFHRPCAECISGVPDALTLTMMYNMEALKEKCVKWINKNFVKVWPTKGLTTLPQEVLEFCVSSAVNDLALNNVLDILVDCQRLNEKTPRVRWTEPVFDMITQLMDAAIEFASQNFINLVSGNTFRKIDKDGIAFNQQPLEDIFGMIIQALSPENACHAYLALNKWIKTMETTDENEVRQFSVEFEEFVKVLFKKCKEHLCLYIHQVANTAEWDLLSKDMQTSIMQDANYVCIETNRGRMARPKLSSMQKKISATTPLSLKEYFDCHFGQSRPPCSISRPKMEPAKKKDSKLSTESVTKDKMRTLIKTTKDKDDKKSRKSDQPSKQRNPKIQTAPKISSKPKISMKPKEKGKSKGDAQSSCHSEQKDLLDICPSYEDCDKQHDIPNEEMDEAVETERFSLPEGIDFPPDILLPLLIFDFYPPL